MDSVDFYVEKGIIVVLVLSGGMEVGVEVMYELFCLGDICVMLIVFLVIGGEYVFLLFGYCSFFKF